MVWIIAGGAGVIVLLVAVLLLVRGRKAGKAPAVKAPAVKAPAAAAPRKAAPARAVSPPAPVEDMDVAILEESSPEPEIEVARVPEPAPVYEAPPAKQAPSEMEVSFEEDIPAETGASLGETIEIALETDSQADSLPDDLVHEAGSDHDVEIAVEAEEKAPAKEMKKAKETDSGKAPKKVNEEEKAFADEVDNAVDALFGDDF